MFHDLSSHIDVMPKPVITYGYIAINCLTSFIYFEQMGVRRSTRYEGGARKQHPMRLRYPLLRQYESSMRPFQPRHRLRRRSGKLFCIIYAIYII